MNLLVIALASMLAFSHVDTKQIDGTLNEVVNDVAYRDGSVYATGYFNGTIDGLPNEQSHNLPFVLSLDSDFNISWIKAVSYPGNSVGKSISTTETSTAVAIQRSAKLADVLFYGHDGSALGQDNISSTNPLSSSVIFGSGSSGFIFVGTFVGNVTDDEFILTSPDANRWAFLILYNSDGEPQAIQKLGQVSSVESGIFTDFGFAICGSSPSGDIFISAYNWLREPMWTIDGATTGVDSCNGVSSFDGNVYATGYYGLGANEPMTIQGHTVASAGTGADIFLIRVTPAGVVTWLNGYGGFGDDIGNDVSIFEDKLILVGQFQLSLDFGLGAIVSAHQIDALIAVFDLNGAPLHSSGYGSFVTDKLLSVDSTDEGFVAGGFFLFSINFGGGALFSEYSDGVITKFSLTLPTATPTNTAAPPSTSVVPSPTITNTATRTPSPTDTELQNTGTPTPTWTPTDTPPNTQVPTATPTDTPITFIVSGKAFFGDTQKPIPGVEIRDFDIPVATTDLSGIYTFTVADGSVHSISAHYGNKSKEAISSLDASLILNAAVENVTLSPYQAIAADVSGNGTISSFDAGKVLQYRVELIEELPVCGGQPWIFFPQDGVPPEIYSDHCVDGFSSFEADSNKVFDFRGVLFGDVTENW